MRKTATKIGLALSLIFVAMQANATTIAIVPPDQTVEIDDMVTVDIIIDTGGEFQIGGFQFDLDFDSDILSFMSLAFGGFLGDGTLDFDQGSLQSVFPTGGQLSVFEVALGMDPLNYLQPDSFLLASITFNAVGLGQSGLSISNLFLSDFGFPPSGLDAQVFGGLITVTERPVSVPEPSTWLLLLSGLALVLMRNTKASQ